MKPTTPIEEVLAARTAELEREIEARRSAEEALRESEARYRRIVETAEEGIWTIDAEAQTSFVNPKMADMMGYAAEEMRGRPLLDFMDDEWRTIAQEKLARRQQGIAEEHEFKFLRKDGSELWALLSANPIHDADGAYTGALALVHDITKRRQAENLLRSTEARFRSLFENSPNVLWEEDLSELKKYLDTMRIGGVTDMRAHFLRHPEDVVVCLSKVKVLDVNRAAVRLYEAKDKAELLSGLERILTPESYEVLREEVIAFAEGQTVFESEATDQTFTGRKNHVLLKALVAPGCEETFSRVYISIVDITARKLLEEQLLHSQKMEAIGQLAGGVAHDFNNLLTVIHGNTSILQMDDTSGEHRAEALVEIARATERAAGLTRQLLTFSRRQVLQPRQLDINDIVTGLAKMLERVLGEDVRIQVKLHPRPLLTRADAGMLDQVVMNLVVNARDAMPEGGELTIETSEARVEAEELVRFPDARSGPHVCVRVTDSGGGIPPETLAHIFEPFFTTKAPGKGTGLGLATVFGIIKQHGGAVRVTSEVGRGTTFAILIPATPDVGLAAQESKATLPPRGGSESILLVEDDEPVRRLAQRLLEVRGYRVRVARTGVEALQMWEEGDDAFDLVMTDIIMPGGVSGRDLAERLIALRPGLKVIYMSGYAGEVAGRGVHLHEGINFLQKPFGPTSLLECVRTRLDSA
jgi:PAS domain S-box-containing protein